jgi:hypothetical protein
MAAKLSDLATGFRPEISCPALDHTTGIPARLHTSPNYLHTQSYTVINMFQTYTTDQHNLKLQVTPESNAESHSNLQHNAAIKATQQL